MKKNLYIVHVIGKGKTSTPISLSTSLTCFFTFSVVLDFKRDKITTMSVRFISCKSKYTCKA